MKVFRVKSSHGAGFIMQGEKVKGYLALGVFNPIKYKRKEIKNAYVGILTALNEIGLGLIAVLGLVTSMLALLYFTLPISASVGKAKRSLSDVGSMVDKLNGKSKYGEVE